MHDRRRLWPAAEQVVHAHAGTRPPMARELFRTYSRPFGAMASGSLIGLKTVARINRRLFDDGTALSLDKAEIEITLNASAPNRSGADSSILGTLLERGLDPIKGSQVYSDWTDREWSMQLVEPVVIHP